jgi:hypothetical protein
MIWFNIYNLKCRIIIILLLYHYKFIYFYYRCYNMRHLFHQNNSIRAFAKCIALKFTMFMF